MKSKDAEFPKLSPTGPESAEDAVYDFLYVDRARISTLYAQLFPQGTLTSVKTTAQTGFSDDRNIGSDIKVVKAEVKYADSGSEGIEHVFDAAWSIPLEVLNRLGERSLIRSSLKSPQLGAIVLLDGFLRIIDYGTMKNLWEPAINWLAGQDQSTAQGMIALLKALPHAVHAHFLTSEAFLWSSLEPTNLTIPTADIVLKHGGSVSGSWKVLCVVDAYPDSGQAPDFGRWSAGEATDGVLNAMHALRIQIGRPSAWFGVTPLLIYREIAPYSAQGALDLAQPESQI